MNLKLEYLRIHRLKYLLYSIIIITLAIVIILQTTYFRRPVEYTYENFMDSREFSGIDERNCNQPEIKTIVHPFNAIAIDVCGDILNRIYLFGIGLDQIRNEELKSISETSDWNLSPIKIKPLCEWSDDFHESLSNYPQVKTKVLPWLKSTDDGTSWSSLVDTSNILINKYYESTASDILCKWIETRGNVVYSYDVINNWTCNRNTTIATQPKSLSLLALNAKMDPSGFVGNKTKFPEHYYTKLPDYVFSIYMLKKGVVKDDGNVFSGNVALIFSVIWPSLTVNLQKEITEFVHYKEVFVITQNLGYYYYHGMIDIMSRIGPYVEFLQRHPTIKIHVPKKPAVVLKVLFLLGFHENRTVRGYCRAEIVYLPRFGGCFVSQVAETQLLSRHYRNYIAKNLKPRPRDTVVVIRRTGVRRFSNHTDIEKVVESAATDYNLSFRVFTDQPTPSVNNTALLFNSAVMVVASHGAGLSNLVFSKPGTFVIEVVCNRPAVYLCFQRLALVLGHRYHGIPATGGCVTNNKGVINVKPSTVNETVRDYLEQWRQHKAVQ